MCFFCFADMGSSDPVSAGGALYSSLVVYGGDLSMFRNVDFTSNALMSSAIGGDYCSCLFFSFIPLSFRLFVSLSLSFSVFSILFFVFLPRLCPSPLSPDHGFLVLVRTCSGVTPSRALSTGQTPVGHVTPIADGGSASGGAGLFFSCSSS